MVAVAWLGARGSGGIMGLAGKCMAERLTCSTMLADRCFKQARSSVIHCIEGGGGAVSAPLPPIELQSTDCRDLPFAATRVLAWPPLV